eukprot:823366-Pyramimonas_sp.AAC.1
MPPPSHKIRQHRNHVRAPHDHAALFFDKDERGADRLPAARRLIAPISTQYYMRFPATIMNGRPAISLQCYSS